MKKRVLSLLLALAMCLSLSVPAWASVYEETNLSRLIRENKIVDDTKVFSDVDFLASKNIPSYSLVNISTSNTGQLKYFYQLTEKVLAEITITETAEGKMLTAKEGSLVNNLLIKKDGSFVLDGNPVVLSNVDTFSTPSSTLLPRYYGDIYYTETCPYGYPYEYYNFKEMVKSPTGTFGNAFINLTLTIFTFLLGEIINPILGLSVGIISGILTAFQTTAPYSSAASYQDSIMYHRKGHQVTTQMAVYRHNIKMWPVENYGGEEHKDDYVSVTSYEVWPIINGEG